MNINECKVIFTIVLVVGIVIGLVASATAFYMLYPPYKIETEKITIDIISRYTYDYGNPNIIGGSNGEYYKLAHLENIKHLKVGDTVTLRLKVYDPPEGYKWDYEYNQYTRGSGNYHYYTNKKVTKITRVD